MKKTWILLLCWLAVGTAWAQQPREVRPAENHGKFNMQQHYRMEYENLIRQQFNFTGDPIGMGPVQSAASSSSGKTNNVTVINIGRASNPFTLINSRQNQVFAMNSLNLVGWIHRQDVSSWGGTPTVISNGVLRVDYSLNGGATWTLDQGPLNPIPYPIAANPRYPQTWPFFRSGVAGSTMEQVRFPWISPLTDGTKWGNLLSGNSWNLPNYCVSNCGTPAVAPSGYAPTTKNVKTKFGFLSNSQNQRTLIPGQIWKGKGNEVWFVDQAYFDTGIQNSPNNVTLDSLVLFKGTVDANDSLILQRYQTFRPNLFVYSNANSNNDRYVVGWSVAFSPDKKWGWVAQAADLREPGGLDQQQLEPQVLLWYSDDSGATWKGADPNNINVPIAVNLRNFNNIRDSILTQFSNGTTTTGIPSMGEFDMVVDANGNPHIFTNVVNASPVPRNAQGQFNLDSIYFVSTGARSSMWDITTCDQGKTFGAKYIAEVNGFRGTIAGTDLSFRMFPQAAVTENGTHIFFSWVADINPKVQPNAMSPNLYGRGLRVADDAMTPVIEYTSGTKSAYPGRIFFPSMAPTALTRANGSFHTPIVFLTRVNPAGAEVPPSEFGYISDINYTNSQFVLPARDLNVTALSKPAAVLCPGSSSDSVRVTIKNDGNAPVTSFRASFTVRGPANFTSQTYNVNRTIAVGASVDYTFPVVAPLALSGSYDVTVNIVSFDDNNFCNNTRSRTVSVVGGASSRLFASDTLKGCGSLTIDPGLPNQQITFTNLTNSAVTTGQTTLTLNTLTSGDSIRVSVISSCGTLTQNIVAVVNDLPSITALDKYEACDGTPTAILINNNFGATTTTGLAFRWLSPAGVQVSTNNEFTPTTSGIYTAEITNTGNGCVNSKAVEVVYYNINVNLRQALIADLTLSLPRAQRRKPYNTSGFVGNTDTLNVCQRISFNASNTSNEGSTFTWYRKAIGGLNQDTVISNSFDAVSDTAGFALYWVVITDPLNCKTIRDSVWVRVSRQDSAKISEDHLLTFPDFTYRVGRRHLFWNEFDNNDKAPNNPAPNAYYWVVQGQSSLVQGVLGTSLGTVLGTDTIGLTFNSTGRRLIALIRTHGACSDTDQITIQVQVASASEPSLGENGSISLYPNPTMGRFTMEMVTSLNTAMEAQILDLNGRIVLRDMLNVTAGEERREYDLTGLSDGIYIYRINTPNGVINHRIIKTSR